MAVGEYYDKLETMSPAKRQQYLDKKLREQVAYAYQHSPAVKASFDKAGIKPGDIKTTKDLEKLPIIRKTDLLEMQKANLPDGGIIGMPKEDVERIFISPGPIYEIQPSTCKWFAKAFWAAGFRRGRCRYQYFYLPYVAGRDSLSRSHQGLRGDSGGGGDGQYRPADTDNARA